VTVASGVDPGVEFGEGRSSAKGARIEVWGGCVPMCPLPLEEVPSPPKKMFKFWGLEMHCILYFDAFSGPSKCMLLHCNISSSRARVCLSSLEFQADCGFD